MSYDSSKPTADLILRLDQYTGKVLADVRFSHYAAMNKYMTGGVALHECQMAHALIRGMICAATSQNDSVNQTRILPL